MNSARPAERSAALVLVMRGAFLFAALALVAASWTASARREPTASALERYSCPMHPEVTATEAGECPICKMALEPARRDGKGNASSASCETAHGPVAARSAATPVEKSRAPSPLGATWLPETFPPSLALRTTDAPVTATPRFRTFHDDVRAPAWLEAPERLAVLLYRDELVGMKTRERAVFFRAAAPRTPIEVELDADAPKLWDASTVLVHFVLAKAKGVSAAQTSAAVPRTGDVGFVELESRARELMVVPESAILRSSEGAYVLVAGAGAGAVVRRSVELGRARRGHAVVVSGLGETDRVVVSNAFFLDAQRAPQPDVEAVAGVGP